MAQVRGATEFAIYIDNLSKKTKKASVTALAKAGRHLRDKIKDKFGEYQKGWPKLKRATVIAKYRRRALKGIKSHNIKIIGASFGGDDPLILYGNLSKSIKLEVNEKLLEASIYSDNPYAAVHEYGYKNVPSRSYMRLTLYEEEDEIFNIVNREIGNTI